MVDGLRAGRGMGVVREKVAGRGRGVRGWGEWGWGYWRLGGGGGGGIEQYVHLQVWEAWSSPDPSSSATHSLSPLYFHLLRGGHGGGGERGGGLSEGQAVD